MENVELKVRVPTVEPIRSALAEMGVSRAAQLEQVDTYFRGVRQGARLKVREMPEGAELIAYRRPDVAGARRSTYTRTPIAEPAGCTSALSEALGVRVVVHKARELYLHRHTRVHLDMVRGLGAFVELETQVEAIGLAEAERECAAIAAALGIDALPPIPNGYADLLEEKVGV